MPLPALEARGRIEGIVLDAGTGAGLAGVLVVATSSPPGVTRAQVTDLGGSYVITHLPEGSHEVAFSRSKVRVRVVAVIADARRPVAVNARLAVPASPVRVGSCSGRSPAGDWADPLERHQWPASCEYMHTVPLPGRTFEKALRGAGATPRPNPKPRPRPQP